MKKWRSLFLCLVFLLAMTGCANNRSASKPGSNRPAGVNDVLKQGMTEADNKPADNAGVPTENNAQSQQNSARQDTQAPQPSLEPDTDSVPTDRTDEVDVDLTVLSSTMVYSEVYNMTTNPESYIGKTVKANGLFAYYHNEATGKDYFVCMIQDASACCAQGIEFFPTEDYTYPDDYPAHGEEICVIGVFDTYKEGNYTFCTLRNARLL